MSGRSGLGNKDSRHDAAYRRAKQENYAGRAIYKLEDLDQNFRLIRQGMKILDLGCWPGSWLQYASQRAGSEASLVGIDLKRVEIALGSNVHCIVGDVYKLKTEVLRERYGPFDLVMSDMAPHTTGDTASDVWHSEEIFLRALAIAREVGRPGAHFVGKIFQGPRFGEITKAVRDLFQETKPYRSKHTRNRSREQYIVGRGLRLHPKSTSLLTPAQPAHCENSENQET
jgi:23S rRNA (uridine2552-2'-O)-methyltransferase